MPDAKGKEGLKSEDLDFVNLLLMLGNTASVELGDKAAKGSDKKAVNLPRARQFINMLKALEEKTAGRLTPTENEVMKKLMADLQEKYVKASGLDQMDPQLSSLGRMAAQAYGRNKSHS
jgi:hypothetical protein